MSDIGLTIDFDFFVPEDTMWDMQHAETQLHHKILWLMRHDLLDKMLTNKLEKTFWQTILHQFNVDEAELSVSDSHAWALSDGELSAADIIVNFDRHHDCWAIEKQHAEVGKVACHNWLSWWLMQDCDRELLWVYPDDLDLDDYDRPIKEVRDQVSQVAWSDFRASKWFGPDDTVISTHVCRSGCWVPPWLDEDFLRFVKAPDFRITNLQEDPDWDPLTPRWADREEQIAAMLKMQNEWQKFRKVVEKKNESERGAKAQGAGR